MGILWSRNRKKRSHLEELEGIEEEIVSLEDFGQETLKKKQKIVGRLIVISVLIYIITAALMYFCLFPTSLQDGMLYTLPLVAFPAIIVLLKKFLTWHFESTIKRNKKKLVDLRGKKKKVLDEVMEKETFKVAKEILEKYAPDQLKNKDEVSKERKQLKEESLKKVVEINRVMQQQGRALVQQNYPPAQRPPPYVLEQRPQFPTNQMQGGTQRRLIRPICPQNRSILDRLVEALIGDGPNNRYALICKNCATHNGMALKEEFEFIAFRCVYCGFPNPSRKTKPRAPLLPEAGIICLNPSQEGQRRPSHQGHQVESHQGDRSHEEKAEDESGPVITEVDSSEEVAESEQLDQRNSSEPEVPEEASEDTEKNNPSTSEGAVDDKTAEALENNTD